VKNSATPRASPSPRRLRLADRQPEQLGVLGLATAQRSQRQPSCAGGDDPGRLRGRAQLLLDEVCRSQVARERVDATAVREDERQRRERPVWRTNSSCRLESTAQPASSHMNSAARLANQSQRASSSDSMS
jgi:hypothetical protein